MNEQKKDRRVQYTKAQLKSALISIMNEKPLYKTSIKEICEKADINRSTFYSHYDTQYDLYEEIVHDTTNEIKEIILNYPAASGIMDSSGLFRKVLEYVEDNRESCLILLSDNSNITIGESLNSIFDDINEKHDYKKAVKGIDPLFSSYISLYMTSGTISLLWRWLNDENRIPAEEFANILWSISLRGIRAVTRIKQESKSLKNKTESLNS